MLKSTLLGIANMHWPSCKLGAGCEAVGAFPHLTLIGALFWLQCCMIMKILGAYNKQDYDERRGYSMKIRIPPSSERTFSLMR
jgi:hypothetical protein